LSAIVPSTILSYSIVADSSATTGLRWTENYAAGKNKIINGDFNVNQRNFTSTTTHNAYTFDRFQCKATDGTTTLTAQTFTLGTAPVTGYEATNYLDIASTGQTLSSARSGVAAVMESVRTFANQTVTVSFYAKAASGTPSIAYYLVQDFGTGGSPSTAVNINGNKTEITTSWARYSFTVAVPSIAGKTFGTNNNNSFSLLIYVSAGSNFNTLTNSLGIQTTTISIWGVQVEAGSVASEFQTATGTIQGELAACQRYYYRISDPAGTQLYTAITVLHDNSAQNSTTVYGITANPVPMRAVPTSTEFSEIAFHRSDGTIFPISAVTIDSATDSTYGSMYNLTVSGVTAGNVGRIIGNNNSGTYFGVSAEL
jgi:hypothetical protein